MTNESRRPADTGPFPAFGVLMIGLGLIALAGWWWPGVALALGAAGSFWFLQRGQRIAAVWTAIVFVIVPLISYAIVLAFLLVRTMLPIALIALGIGLMYGWSSRRRFGSDRGFSRS